MEIRQLKKNDADKVVWLIAKAMNDDEARWARKTIHSHLTCRRAGVDDGRRYYVWTQGDSIDGVVGLHCYIWGPPENVWLAWFAVSPLYQCQGWGSKLLAFIESEALSLGYRMMFIETYESPEFDKARNFYSAKGYTVKGTIKNYLPDGTSMTIMGKQMSQQAH